MRIFNPYIALLFLVLYTHGVASAQKSIVKISKAPEWINVIEAGEHKTPSFSEISNGYYYQLIDKQYNDLLQTYYYHFKIKVISETGVQNVSNISAYYNPAYQQLVFHSLKVIRGDEEINQLETNSFKLIQAETERERFIYNEQLSADCLLHDVRKGDCIEYSYSVIGTNPVFKNKFFKDILTEFSDPVGRYYYRFVFSPEKKIFVQYAKTNLKFNIDSQKNEYVLDVQNINATRYGEDQVPSWHIDYGYIQLTEFETWHEFAQWVSGIYQNDAPNSPELISKIEELRKANPRDDDFVLSCIRFVQDDVRYAGIEIGENTQKPFSPSLVFSRRFGDCKDKSFLLCTMLKHAGLVAYPVLVNSNYKHIIEEWLPSPSSFNHCIVKFNFEGKTYWVDPTNSLQRGSLDLLSFPDYRRCLVISDKTTSLDIIPEKIISKIETFEQYSLNDTGQASYLTVISIYEGVEADVMRSSLASSSRKDLENSYTEFYARIFPNIMMTDSIIVKDIEKDNKIEITETYRIDNLWEKLESGWKANFYAHNLSNRINIPETKSRKSPIALNYPLDFTQKIYITPPSDDWNIEDTQTAISEDGFEYTSSSRYDGKTIYLNYHLKTTKDHISIDKVASYIKKADQAIDDTGYTFTWDPGVSAKNASVNWMMVLLLILFLAAWAFVMVKLYQRDFNAVPHYETSSPIGGWLILLAIGLVLRPFIFIYQIFTNNFFNLQQWNLISTPVASSYNPGLSVLWVLELFCNAFLICYGIYLLFLFYNHRTTFPKSMIIFFIAAFSIMSLDAMSLVWLKIDKSIDPDSLKEIIRTFVAGTLWSLYLIYSERVKETFNETYGKAKGQVKSTVTVEPVVPDRE